MVYIDSMHMYPQKEIGGGEFPLFMRLSIG
jgi:hypothetical protein